VKKQTENWLKIAKYELSAAEALFKNELYLKSVEHCHAALEKLLKGLITSNDQEAPRIHDLLRLASLALVENLQSEITPILDEVNRCYMISRYPDDIDDLLEEINNTEAERILKETKRIFAWLNQKIK
jgi:HEPN domain-containing protein